MNVSIIGVHPAHAEQLATEVYKYTSITIGLYITVLSP